ncbi:MAG: proteasome accessory factor PafA2 family protein [Planctomycetales bacterium]|nr:proteasome accessory factor PafA2 family protein [Planctomycetales bacterium]
MSLDHSEPVSVFDRLAGLETEYVLYWHSNSGLDGPSNASKSEPSAGEPPTKFELYEQLLSELRRQIPTAEAMSHKPGVFLATGGAVWFEASSRAPTNGLLEGATPEARGPRQVLIAQRAQDALLRRASEATKTRGGELVLVKNDRDAQGNTYGAKENYEARLAHGWRLLLWRAGIVALLPFCLLAALATPLLECVLLFYWALTGVAHLALSLILPENSRALARLFGGEQWRAGELPTPKWLERALCSLCRLLILPIGMAVWALCRGLAFRTQRRKLLPFLVSRAAICGAGHLDDKGSFHLAEKQPGLTAVDGLGQLIGERPIFSFGHFCRALLTIWDWRELLQSRQRLQIHLGDSNMCPTAEYLRIGTTMLVLDAIEAGEMPEPPRPRNPLQACDRLCRDVSLVAEVECDDGRSYSALELQRFYLDACRAFLHRRPYACDEAFEVLHLWEQTLELLVEYKQLGEPPESLIGAVDWLTKWTLVKRSLQVQSVPSGDAIAETQRQWEAAKKIDIRYHELSSNGYFQWLTQAIPVEPIVTEKEIERGMRNAPPNSPATTRGHYIREFSVDGAAIRASWTKLKLRGWPTRTVRLRSRPSRFQTPRRANAVRLDGHQRES